MNLYLKPGLDLRLMSPQILLAALAAADVFDRHGKPCRVTSVHREGTYEQVMLHGTGNAADLGLRDLDGTLYEANVIDSIVDELRHRIGREAGQQFDVVNEVNAPGGPHIHLEFDPK